MIATLHDLAKRYMGVKEIAGNKDHPLILWWLSLCASWATHDEVPWCSAFINGMCWELELERSKDLRARSWLKVGQPVPLADARIGFDVVILKRGSGIQPGPDVIDAPGHVTLFGGQSGNHFYGRGGNQNDGVSDALFPIANILGIRRVAA